MMTLRQLLRDSGIMDSVECGHFIKLRICTESEEETVLTCTAACPLLYYLRDIRVSSFEPDQHQPDTLEIWVKDYKGAGKYGVEYWDEFGYLPVSEDVGKETD